MSISVPRWQKIVCALFVGGIVIPFLLVRPTPARAGVVEKCGTITSDETWLADNIYVVTCSIVVPVDIVVSVDAGTVIKMQESNYSWSVTPGHMKVVIFGTLKIGHRRPPH